MKYYIIAGEASGDLHGSNLIKELKKEDPNANIRCWGGDLMQAAGGTVVKHYKDLAFMGFVEVIKNLPAIFKNLKFCKEDILSFQPHVLVLIDYPGFNLRIAKWAKEKALADTNGNSVGRSFKIVYYISPQVWAWKENRVKGIKKYVDKMLVILPFEKEFYAKWDYNVEYIGHPLVQVVEDELGKKEDKELVIAKSLEAKENFKDTFSTKENKPIIALLPGSREQEIKVKLPIMLEASKKFTDYNFIVAQAPGQPVELYTEMIRNYPNVNIAISGQTYSLLKRSVAALVTSGTATLETALFNVPQIVCYKGSHISYQIAKRLVKIKFISLVNLILDKPAVKELIQQELTVKNIEVELDLLLHNEVRINEVKKDYKLLKELLQHHEKASTRAAQEVIGMAQSISL